MGLIHILVGVITAILRALTGALLMLFSSVFAAGLALLLLGFVVLGATGILGAGAARRRRNRHD